MRNVSAFSIQLCCSVAVRAGRGRDPPSAKCYFFREKKNTCIFFCPTGVTVELANAENEPLVDRFRFDTTETNVSEVQIVMIKIFVDV